MAGGNITWLQYRGRWESARSMRHYIQAGLAMQAYSSLSMDTKLRIATLADLAPTLLLTSPNFHQEPWQAQSPSPCFEDDVDAGADDGISWLKD
eukprot:4372771-Amphidinium_carterae.3